jgi:hypothetical protein
VVQTGVKSFGCENRIAHPSPSHSWKLIVPSVVAAVKSGALSLIRNVIVLLLEELDAFERASVTDVLWLDVPVDDIVLVRVVQRVGSRPACGGVGALPVARTRGSVQEPNTRVSPYHARYAVPVTFARRARSSCVITLAWPGIDRPVQALYSPGQGTAAGLAWEFPRGRQQVL